MDVLQVPFLFQTYEEVDTILKKMDSFFRKGIEDSGYVLLGWSEAGFIYLMSTVPVASVADLRKAKVWIWEESMMSKAIFDEAGVSAIPLSIPDVLVGLQTGIVDVVYVPPTYAISLQWFTKIKYMTNIAFGLSFRWDRSEKRYFTTDSQPFQNTIIASCQHHLDRLKIVTRNENQEAIKVIMKQGVKMITPSKDQVEEFKKLSNKAMGHVSGETFSKRVLNEVSSYLEHFRGTEKP
jgi:TRAP-type C4-dicarboxylate transport system substrate-binding protein